MSSNQRNKSFREQNEEDNTDKRSFKLKPGIRNYILFTCTFSALAILWLSTGWWEVENDSWDVGLRIIGIGLPLSCIAFIQILES